MKQRTLYAIIIFVASLVLALIASKVAIFMLPYILSIGAISLATVMLLEVYETHIPTSQFKTYEIAVRAMNNATFPNQKDFEEFYLNEVSRFTDAGFIIGSRILSGYKITYTGYKLHGLYEGVYQPVLSLCAPWSKWIQVGLSSHSHEPLHEGILGHELRLSLVYEIQKQQGEISLTEQDKMRLMNEWGVYNNGPDYGSFLST